MQTIYDLLYAKYGECGCPLLHETPFQLLCAVMLSAQCRDDRVNQVTPELFRRWGTPETMANADPDAVAEVIRVCGLFVNKSRNLVLCARQIVERHNGIVPDTMEDLSALAGVGRKSANVILGNAFGLPGFPVDTHVNRVLNRLQRSGGSTDPVKIEFYVNARMPEELLCNFSHLLIRHGRDICHARNPECSQCLLAAHCPARTDLLPQKKKANPKKDLKK